VTLLNLAARVSRAAHEGQMDKAGRDYYRAHVANVVARLVIAGHDDTVLAVGFLHDVLEDTATTEAELRACFPAEVVDAVVALTRRDAEHPDAYYARVRSNPLALCVKLDGDIPSNTDPRRLALLDPVTRARLRRKYRHALRVLLD
jgi:hypothetical protein